MKRNIIIKSSATSHKTHTTNSSMPQSLAARCAHHHHCSNTVRPAHSIVPAGCRTHASPKSSCNLRRNYPGWARVNLQIIIGDVAPRRVPNVPSLVSIACLFRFISLYEVAPQGRTSCWHACLGVPRISCISLVQVVERRTQLIVRPPICVRQEKWSRDVFRLLTRFNCSGAHFPVALPLPHSTR
jgi:hypothetical protein